MVKKILSQAYIWLILLFMYLPIIVLVAYSFSESSTIGGSFTFSLALYPKLFKNEEIMRALGNTVLIAIISALVATLLGTLGAIGAFYSKKKVKKTIDMTTQIPVVNAEIVVAFSLTVMFVFIGTLLSKWFNKNINLFGFWTLLIGHVSLSIPFVYLNVKPKLQQMDPSLYEAAMDLGASPRVALWKTTLPEIMPGVVSGFLLAITLSLDDFIVTSFTRGSGLLSGNGNIETISTYVQDHMKRKSIPAETRALITLIFVSVVIGVIIISFYRYQKSKANAKEKRRLY